MECKDDLVPKGSPERDTVPREALPRPYRMVINANLKEIL